MSDNLLSKIISSFENISCSDTKTCVLDLNSTQMAIKNIDGFQAVMDNKKIETNFTIKTEPNASAPKKVILSASTFAQLGNKNVSNARLASFKPPRDLLLTGSTTGSSNSAFNLSSGSKGTRRTFVPNINVTRRKGNNETSANDSSSDSNQKNKGKERDRDKKPQVNKKRNANVVQTRGVFSEGLAPGKVKAFSSAHSERTYNERQVLDKPKLNLNKKVIKSEEDTKLKSVFKDDFINDPSLIPDITFIPTSLPIVYNVNKSENGEDLEKTFETLQVKPEKVSNVNINELKSENPNLSTVFEGGKDPKLFLFEFPSLLQHKEELSEKKKYAKGQQNETDNETENSETLSSLGEGFLGYLRIHENGKAYLVRGKTLIPLCVTRHGTRQEVMSTSIDTETSKGEVISLGTVDASFTCSANFFQDVS